MFNNFARCLCLLVFALGLLDGAGWLPASWSAALPLSLAHIAVLLLLIHVLELVVAKRYLSRYRGPLVASVALHLLFGLMHWKPLADAAAAEVTPSKQETPSKKETPSARA